MANVAVIMSVYVNDNLDDFRNSINSMIFQTVKCHIYIFVDGRVYDKLNQYLCQLSMRDDIFVHFSEINVGLAQGLNYLIDSLNDKGYQFIARMDSDDISRPNRLERQIDYFNHNQDVDVAGTFCSEFGSSFALSNKTVPCLHQEIVEFSISRCPFIHPTVMFRSNVFSEGNLPVRYLTDTRYTEDMALWFLLIERGYKLGNLNETLLDYRLNENTVIRRFGIKKLKSEVKLRLSYMFKLRMVSFRNLFYILSRVPFHLMPPIIMKYCYRNMR